MLFFRKKEANIPTSYYKKNKQKKRGLLIIYLHEKSHKTGSMCRRSARQKAAAIPQPKPPRHWIVWPWSTCRCSRRLLSRNVTFLKCSCGARVAAKALETRETTLLYVYVVLGQRKGTACTVTCKAWVQLKKRGCVKRIENCGKDYFHW